MTNDPLREALAGLADDVHEADLYGGAVRRSRRIAHQRAAAGTLSALTVLGLACGGLWYLDPPGGSGDASSSSAIAPPVPVAPAPGPSGSAGTAPALRAPAAAPRTPPPRQPHPTRAGTATPRSRSLSDLPGEIFYARRDEPEVLRLDSAGRTRTVLDAPHAALGVSPDGSRIAYVRDGELLIAPTGGGPAERPYAGKVSPEQAPAWSPDGARLLIDADEPAVLDVADGTLQALPSSLAGSHFRWSGDGRKLIYATAGCQLKVADATPEAVTDPAVTVPVLGDPDASDNPSGLGACRPISVDATGRRVAVPLEQVDGADGADPVANAIVDTATGGTDVLPVAGVVIGAVFDADGDLLVRTVNEGRTTLSLFSASNALLVQAHEPSRLHGLDLVAYTH